MGCAPAAKKAPLQMKQSPVGVLKVTILGAELYNHPKVVKPHIKIRVSNQTWQTDFVVPPASDNTGETFTFAINSFYKPRGRAIQIGYFDGDNLLYFGSIDANTIIVNKMPQETRCILNKTGMSQVGYVLLKCSFEEAPYQDLNFRFEQATIRRKTGSCGEDNVAAKLTIGEQEHQTEHLPNSLEKPPVWSDKVYNFKVPQNLKRGFLQLIDDRNNVIGAAELNLEDYTNVKEGEEIIETQTLYHTQDKKQINAADIKYSFINGQRAEFGPRDVLNASIMRAVRPQGEITQGSVIIGEALNRSFQGPIDRSNQFSPQKIQNSTYQAGQTASNGVESVKQSTYTFVENTGNKIQNTVQKTAQEVHGPYPTTGESHVNNPYPQVTTYVAKETVINSSDPAATSQSRV